MTRKEILENLKRIEGTTLYILIFDHIEDQLLNSNYNEKKRLHMLIQMKDKYSQIKPEPNGRYELGLALPPLRSKEGDHLMRRTGYPVKKQTYDLVLSYIDECIKQLQPRRTKPIKPFRDALLLENKDEFIEVVKPHLKYPKSFTLFYFALIEMGVISEMKRNEAHLILSAEFAYIGAKQYFSRELKRLIESKPAAIGYDERLNIDRFKKIISRYTPDSQG
jgi:hypothetical protein